MSVFSPDEKAERARQLLDDPLLKEMFNQVKQDALDRFCSSASRDQHVRESAYYEVQAVEAVKSGLESAIVDMKLKSHDQKG